MIQEAQQSLWQIETKNIDPKHYFGAMVANGMIGVVSDALPMQVKDVILNMSIENLRGCRRGLAFHRKLGFVERLVKVEPVGPSVVVELGVPPGVNRFISRGHSS